MLLGEWKQKWNAEGAKMKWSSHVWTYGRCVDIWRVNMAGEKMNSFLNLHYSFFGYTIGTGCKHNTDMFKIWKYIWRNSFPFTCSRLWATLAFKIPGCCNKPQWVLLSQVDMWSIVNIMTYNIASRNRDFNNWYFRGSGVGAQKMYQFKPEARSKICVGQHVRSEARKDENTGALAPGTPKQPWSSTWFLWILFTLNCGKKKSMQA